MVLLEFQLGLIVGYTFHLDFIKIFPTTTQHLNHGAIDHIPHIVHWNFVVHAI